MKGFFLFLVSSFFPPFPSLSGLWGLPQHHCKRPYLPPILWMPHHVVDHILQFPDKSKWDASVARHHSQGYVLGIFLWEGIQYFAANSGLLFHHLQLPLPPFSCRDPLKEGGPRSWSWGPRPPRCHQPLWPGSCLALASLPFEDGSPALDPSLVDSRNWDLICMEDLPRTGRPPTEWQVSHRKTVTCLPASASQRDLLLDPIPGLYFTDGPLAFAPWRSPSPSTNHCHCYPFCLKWDARELNCLMDCTCLTKAPVPVSARQWPSFHICSQEDLGQITIPSHWSNQAFCLKGIRMQHLLLTQGVYLILYIQSAVDRAKLEWRILHPSNTVKSP